MLERMRVGKKLAFGFGILLAIMLIVALISIIQLGILESNISIIVRDRYVKVDHVTHIQGELNQQASSIRDMLITDKMSEIEKENNLIIDSREIIKKHIDALSETLSSEKGKKMLTLVDDLRNKYIPLMDFE